MKTIALFRSFSRLIRWTFTLAVLASVSPAWAHFCFNDPVNHFDSDGQQVFGGFELLLRASPVEPLIELPPPDIETIEMPFKGPGVGFDGPEVDPSPTAPLPPPFPVMGPQPAPQPQLEPQPNSTQQRKRGESAEYYGNFHLQHGTVKEFPRSFIEEWRQSSPPTKQQGHAMFEKFWDDISFKQDELADEYKRINKFIDEAPSNGYPYPLLKSFPRDVGKCWHIDVEIIRGNAFVNPAMGGGRRVQNVMATIPFGF